MVLTMGSFDLLHEGHMVYLEKAKAAGSRLLVGIDDDAKVRRRKGPLRPVFDERQRLARVAHVVHVDGVVLKRNSWSRWELIKAIRPAVLVCSVGNYDHRDLQALAAVCGRIEVLPRHPEVSTEDRLDELLGKLPPAPADRVSATDDGLGDCG